MNENYKKANQVFSVFTLISIILGISKYSSKYFEINSYNCHFIDA